MPTAATPDSSSTPSTPSTPSATPAVAGIPAPPAVTPVDQLVLNAVTNMNTAASNGDWATVHKVIASLQATNPAKESAPMRAYTVASIHAVRAAEAQAKAGGGTTAGNPATPATPGTPTAGNAPPAVTPVDTLVLNAIGRMNASVTAGNWTAVNAEIRSLEATNKAKLSVPMRGYLVSSVQAARASEGQAKTGTTPAPAGVPVAGPAGAPAPVTAVDSLVLAAINRMNASAAAGQWGAVNKEIISLENTNKTKMSAPVRAYLASSVQQVRAREPKGKR